MELQAQEEGRSGGDHGCNTDKCNTILGMSNSCLWLFHLLFGMTGELIIGSQSIRRSDRPPGTVSQAAQHCSSGAVWFGFVRLPGISSVY